MAPSSPPPGRSSAPSRRAGKGPRLGTRWRAGMRGAVRDWKAIEEFDRRGVAIARVALLAMLWFSIVYDIGYGATSAGVLWSYVGVSCAFVAGFRWVFLFARMIGVAVVPFGVFVIVASLRLEFPDHAFLRSFLVGAGNVLYLCALRFADRQISTVLLFITGSTLAATWMIGSPGAALAAEGLALVIAYVGYVGSSRGAEAQRRAARIRQQQGSARESFEPELAPERRRLVEDCLALVGRAPGVALGLGGRRGLGKSNVLRLVLARFAGPARQRAPTEADLWKAKSALPTSIGVFVRTPTTFDELNFITALHEQVALAANRAVAGILPAVQPYAVERELQHKRRLLRPMHLLGVALVLVTVACSILPYVVTAPDDPVLGAAARRWAGPPPPPSDTVPRFARDGTIPADALSPLDELLMLSRNERDYGIHAVPLSDTSWNRWRERHARLQGAWGDLAPYRARLDSARMLAAQAHAIFDSVGGLAEAVRGGSGRVPRPAVSTDRRALFYAGLIGLPLLLLAAFRATREGDVRLRSRAYDPVRYVVALHERTNEVLERLRYQLIPVLLSYCATQARR